MMMLSAPPTWQAERLRGSEPELLTATPPPAPAEDERDCLPKDPPPPVVKVKVRVPAVSEPGQPIEYRICVENCSRSEAHHVILKDALPANARFVKADPEPTQYEPELQWQLGTIGGGACREITLVLQPKNQEDVKNCLRVQFEHGVCLVTRQSAYPLQPGMQPGQPGQPGLPGQPPGPPGPGMPGTKPPTVTPVPEAKGEAPILDLKIDGPTTQYINLDAQYIITVTNKGATKLTNVQAQCRLPSTLKAVKWSDPGVNLDDVVAWNLGQIEPGKSRLLELTLRSSAKGVRCFNAIAVADGVPKVVATKCTEFLGDSAMSLEMNDRDDPIFLGDKTSYPIVIRNLGSVPVTRTVVRAFVPDALKLDRTEPVKFETEPPVAGGRWIKFAALPAIDVGTQARYEIFVVGAQAGATKMRIEVTAEQLESGPVIWEELTNIVDDSERAKYQGVSRKRSQHLRKF